MLELKGGNLISTVIKQHHTISRPPFKRLNLSLLSLICLAASEYSFRSIAVNSGPSWTKRKEEAVTMGVVATKRLRASATIFIFFVVAFAYACAFFEIMRRLSRTSQDPTDSSSIDILIFTGSLLPI